MAEQQLSVYMNSIKESLGPKLNNNRNSSCILYVDSHVQLWQLNQPPQAAAVTNCSLRENMGKLN